MSSRITMLLKAHKDSSTPLGIVQRRLDLRAQRPSKEALQDYVQDALEKERAAMRTWRQRMLNQIQAGQDILQSLEDCKEQLVACVKYEKDIVKLDRSCLLFDGFHTEDGVLKRKEKAQRSRLRSGAMGGIRELLDNGSQLQQLGQKFAAEADEVLAKSKRSAEHLVFVTNKSLSKRIAETAELKRKLEKECVETGNATKRMEQSLEIMQSQLRANSTATPRNRTRLSVLLDEHREHLANESVGLLDDLGSVTRGVLERAMAAAGSKTSLVGLQKAERILAPHAELIELAMQRIEAQSAQVGQPRDAARKLHQLTTKLHGQQESVDSELDAVREAKEDVTHALEERVQWAEETLDQLRSTHREIDSDLQNKAAAWKIDTRCLTVSARDLDGSAADPSQASDSAHRLPSSKWQLQTPRPYRPPLKPDVVERLREKVRAASYTGHAGCELDVVFRRLDKDGSGQLDEEEFRMALRRTLRIPHAVVTDAQVSSLCAMLDSDGSGTLDVNEIVEFLGAEPEISKRTGRPLHGGLLAPINTVGSPEHVQRTTPRGSVAGNWQAATPRPYRPPLKKAALEAVRQKIKSASYTGVFGRQLDVVFGRFDKDGSGQLEDDEVRQALRRALRIPPKTLSDAQIADFCAALDADNSGAVSIQELVDFVGAEADVSQRTGKRMQSVIACAATFLADAGLPVVNRGRALTAVVESAPIKHAPPTNDFTPPEAPQAQLLPNLAG